MPLRLLVGVPSSFDGLKEPRVRRTVGGNCGSVSDPWSDDEFGECWCFLDGDFELGGGEDAGASRLESM